VGGFNGRSGLADASVFQYDRGPFPARWILGQSGVSAAGSLSEVVAAEACSEAHSQIVAGCEEMRTREEFYSWRSFHGGFTTTAVFFITLAQDSAHVEFPRWRILLRSRGEPASSSFTL
jgi:hypothetical protein